MKIPEIWGVSLKNYKLLQDGMNMKHVEGDQQWIELQMRRIR